MPRIDPQQLLNCLNPLLAQNGGIKSTSEVVRLASLMEKYSKKLVSKCIYTQVLKCTETELLDQFMENGGWNLVHNWLSDGEKTNNWPFIQEILEMLLLCPVDGTRLKSNITPKVVKNLSLSCPHQTVRILSTKLVEQWLKIAHQEKQHSTKQVTTPQINGLTNGDSTNVLNENKVNEALQNEVNGQGLEDDTLKKQSKENVKYKVSNKEGSGKLLLSLKRSTSPSVDEKDSKLSRSSPVENKESKSKSSSSTDKDKDKNKKSSSSSSSHKSSSSSKSSHRDKTRSSSSSSHHKSSSSSSKDKSKGSSKSSSSKNSSSSRSTSRDKDKDKEKRSKDPEKSQAEKDKETLNLLAPLSSSKLQRIPKRQHSDNSENKSSESNKDPSGASPNKIAKSGEPVEKKKPSISIEVRKGDKPKTVKTLNSQFRNHGLAEQPPKPPSRKDLKKPMTSAAPLLLPTSLPSAATIVKTSTSPPPNKKLHLEKAMEADNVPDRVGGVKFTKPKPTLVESIGFMDALSASTVTKKDPKKRKRLPSNSKKDEPESPKIEVKPLKFYKDTFEEAEAEQTNGEKSPTKELDTSSEDKKLKTETKKEAGDSSPEQSIKSNSDEKEGTPDIEVPEEKRPPGVGCGPDGPPGVLVHPNVPRRKKRPIRWRSDEELTEIRYFELDETERTNVSKTFTEQKQMEHVEERSAFKLGRKAQNDDTMVEQIIWRALIIVDFKEEPKVNYGCNSREAVIQAEREKNVLQELYFRHSINDSPHEPDPESYDHVEPQIIPLNDVTGNTDSINNYTDISWPAPKGDLPPTFTPNAFGNVFSHVNITPATGVPPVAAFNPIANPLANFPLGGIINPIGRDVPNHLSNQWVLGQAPFMQQPPPMIPQPMPLGFANNRGGGMNNGFRNNNNNANRNNGSGGNWVRGNARRGICHQFQKNGFCRNNNCQYIHER